MQQPRTKTNTFKVRSAFHCVDNQSDVLTKISHRSNGNEKKRMTLTLILYWLREQLTELSGGAAISNL